ncbi:MAG: hypothetical protein AAF543_15345 [Pseudomonadota bacterium]
MMGLGRKAMMKDGLLVFDEFDRDACDLPDPFGPSLMREFGLVVAGPEVMAGV